MTEYKRLLPAALRYSFPVFLGYIPLGTAFGLYAIEQGYPGYLAQAMGLIMYAGAGQFIAVGMFAAGASLAEAVLIQFVVNARHLAYGLSMIRRFRNAGRAFRWYLIFALTDETFALLSSLPAPLPAAMPGLPDKTEEQSPEAYRADFASSGRSSGRFMFLVAILNHSYWNLGILIGVVAGSIIPWDLQGISFALTALFIVLMIEQWYKVRKAAPFIVSAIIAVAAVLILPGAFSSGFSLLSAMIVSLGIVQLIDRNRSADRNTKRIQL